jgi:hypothetical protein
VGDSRRRGKISNVQSEMVECQAAVCIVDQPELDRAARLFGVKELVHQLEFARRFSLPDASLTTVETATFMGSSAESRKYFLARAVTRSGVSSAAPI